MLTGLDLSLLAWLLAAGLVLDWLLGEARRWHPLVGFGNVAQLVERRLNRGSGRHARGVIAWAVVVLPPVAAACGLIAVAGSINSMLAAALHVMLLYFCVGLRSLRDHIVPIQQALAAGDLPGARRLTARIVSRDTERAAPQDIAKAAVESAVENGNDAVFGTLFWFAIAGGSGALLFRLANTLDAMWGYRTTRFLAFGWSAARIDDALNLVPARLTALSYALLGDKRRAWRCWRTQAAAWPSPNAGPVMSAGAGALGLALGGEAEYDGVAEARPPLGEGRAAEPEDIGRAWQLVARTAVLWTVLFGLGAYLLERIVHA